MPCRAVQIRVFKSQAKVRNRNISASFGVVLLLPNQPSLTILCFSFSYPQGHPPPAPWTNRTNISRQDQAICHANLTRAHSIRASRFAIRVRIDQIKKVPSRQGFIFIFIFVRFRITPYPSHMIRDFASARSGWANKIIWVRRIGCTVSVEILYIYKNIQYA